MQEQAQTNFRVRLRLSISVRIRSDRELVRITVVVLDSPFCQNSVSVMLSHDIPVDSAGGGTSIRAQD